MFTGAAEIGAGGAIALGSSFAAAPIGGAVVAHGFDHLFTGFNSVISGQHNDTVTSQLIQKSGVSAQTANTLDNNLSIIGTMGGMSYLRASQVTALP